MTQQPVRQGEISRLTADAGIAIAGSALRLCARFDFEMATDAPTADRRKRRRQLGPKAWIPNQRNARRR